MKRKIAAFILLFLMFTGFLVSYELTITSAEECDLIAQHWIILINMDFPPF